MTSAAEFLAPLTSGDDALAEAASHRLAEFGAGALPHLLDLIRHADPDHRWWAARAMAGIASPAARQALIGALADAEASVRQCAALALASHPSPESIHALAERLADSDSLTARLAGEALAACGELAVIPLRAKAGSDSTPVRIEAVRSLALMRNPAAAEALFRALEDPSALVVHWAEVGLERLGMGMVFFGP
jgi:HEAT repeat protein